MSLFEKITTARLKDCIIENNQIIFIVQPGMISKAIGKKGANVKTLENKLNRKIKIVEFDSQPVKFIKNFILPTRIDDIEINENIVTIKASDSGVRSILIGRNGNNLRYIEQITQRYFPEIKEIKVV